MGGLIQEDLATFRECQACLRAILGDSVSASKRPLRARVLERWIECYQASERLLASRSVMERQKSEFLHWRPHTERFHREGAQPVRRQLSSQQERRLKRIEIEDRLEEIKKEEAQALEKATSGIEKRFKTCTPAAEIAGWSSWRRFTSKTSSPAAGRRRHTQARNRSHRSGTFQTA
jgi:hypothetical protein